MLGKRKPQVLIYGWGRTEGSENDCTSTSDKRLMIVLLDYSDLQQELFFQIVTALALVVDEIRIDRGTDGESIRQLIVEI